MKSFIDLIIDQNLLYLGHSSLVPLERFQDFQQWLTQKRHGSMSYLESYQDIRKEPALVMDPPARSALVVGLPYKCHEASLFNPQPQIAQYARFDDYHKVLKQKAQVLCDKILIRLDSPSFSGRVCVDTAPILERALGELAGEGFIGKNTCLILPQKGSLFCLGVIFFSFELADYFPELNEGKQKPSIDRQRSDTKRNKSCGSCRRCQVYCPTGALSEDYRIDATKCLSYWSIEHRGSVPEIYWPYFKTFWYGCDICQLVCPYNRKAQIAKELPLERLKNLDLFDVATMDQGFYVKIFAGTAMTRAKIHGLKRNALIALWALKDSRLKKAISYVEANDIPKSSPAAAQMLLETCQKLATHTADKPLKS